MATNDFIGFASAGSANIMSQADYAAAAERGNGVQPGMASSKLANKAWRQGANMAAVIGELIKNHGINALDNGDLVTLYNALLASTASSTLAGLMSAADKNKLDSLISTDATPTAAGYMSAADKALVDSIPGLGTFNKIFFSQTSGSYTAPRTGVYRITLKGGGGGGAGGAAANNGPRGGSGGGEGGTLVLYRTLIKDTAYAYTIGAGGAGGAQNNSGSAGRSGGSTSITINGTTVSANSGGGAVSPAYTSNSGVGGDFSAVPDSFGIYGAPGQTAPFLSGSGLNSVSIGGSGGGAGGAPGVLGGVAYNGRYGGGGAGGSVYYETSYAGGDGGDGYILIEYAG